VTVEPAKDVSVIVCTRNRASRLSAMLDSACRLAVPAGLRWEIIVVDNGSTDKTRDVVDRVAGKLPIRYVPEPGPGLSHARNRGVMSAQARYFCWTDDDVLLDSGWLAAYAQAFVDFSGAAVFGGRILPELEQPTPSWFARYLHSSPLSDVLAQRDPGDRIIPITLKTGYTPYGANFAVRADVQRRFRYNPELGLAPGRMRSGEESDVIYRILKDGGSGWWIPAAKVRHVIATERQTLSHIAAYSRHSGETAAYLHDAFPGDNAREVKRRPAFSFMNRTILSMCIAANRAGYSASSLTGIRPFGLACLTRRCFYEGVGAYYRDRGVSIGARRREKANHV
jgi:glucosyl-dolichyl phosphate glucuronosyltransferase